MPKIYMAEDLFKYKDIDKKWELVKDHYERAYHMIFKERPADDIVFNLYKKMRLLKDDEFFYGNKVGP